MNPQQPDSESDRDSVTTMPFSSIVFLFFAFGAIGSLVQIAIFAIGNRNYLFFHTFYEPVIDWMIGDFPRDGETVVLAFIFVFIVYSTLLGLLGMGLMFSIRWIRSR